MTLGNTGPQVFSGGGEPRTRPMSARDEGLSGIAVRPRPFETIDDTLRRWKRIVQKSGILVDAKAHGHHVKPSEKRRVKSAHARKRRGNTDGR